MYVARELLTGMSDEYLFEDSRSENNSGLDGATESEPDSPPVKPRAMDVANFFSKKRQRSNSSAAGDSDSNEPLPQREDSDRRAMSTSRKEKGQRSKAESARVATPNRHAFERSVTPRFHSSLSKKAKSNENDCLTRSRKTPLSSRSEIPPAGSSGNVSRGEKHSTPVAVANQAEDPCVKSALQEITSLLNRVVERVERVENELKKCSSLTPSSSDSSTPSSKRAIAVPLIVRVSWCTIVICSMMSELWFYPLFLQYTWYMYMYIIHIIRTCVQCLCASATVIPQSLGQFSHWLRKMYKNGCPIAILATNFTCDKFIYSEALCNDSY